MNISKNGLCICFFITLYNLDIISKGTVYQAMKSFCRKDFDDKF